MYRKDRKDKSIVEAAAAAAAAVVYLVHGRCHGYTPWPIWLACNSRIQSLDLVKRDNH